MGTSAARFCAHTLWKQDTTNNTASICQRAPGSLQTAQSHPYSRTTTAQCCWQAYAARAITSATTCGLKNTKYHAIFVRSCAIYCARAMSEENRHNKLHNDDLYTHGLPAKN